MKQDLGTETASSQLCLMKRRFLQDVYFNGLYDVLHVSDGYDVTFSEARLRSHVNRDGTVVCEFTSEVDGTEKSLVIVVADGDTTGESAEIRSVCASLPECIEMMQQVIDCWVYGTGNQSPPVSDCDCTILPFNASKKGE